MAMNPFATYLFSLSEESRALAISLKEILIKERAALITLNTEEILILTTQKESGMMRLSRKRAELKKFARTQYQQDDLEKLSFADPELQKEWEICKSNWIQAWTDLRTLCENNQQFIGHSMKNLDRLVENLKRLLGQHATYSPKGKRIDQSSQGAVVEGRY